jgi:hypothetical protein
MELSIGSSSAMEIRQADTERLTRDALKPNGRSTRSEFLRNYGATINCPRRRQEGFSPLTGHDNLMTTLGAHAVNYLSVTISLRDAILASSNPPTPCPEPEAQFDNCDHAILITGANQPFALVRELLRLNHQPRTTVDRRLAKSCGFASAIFNG